MHAPTELMHIKQEHDTWRHKKLHQSSPLTIDLALNSSLALIHVAHVPVISFLQTENLHYIQVTSLKELDEYRLDADVKRSKPLVTKLYSTLHYN